MDTNKETDTGITKRQRLINELVNDLVATRTNIMLVMRFKDIMDSKDLPLIMAAHQAVGRRVVDAIQKATETQDPQCPLYEYYQNANGYYGYGQFKRDLEHVVCLFEAGCQPQNEPDGYREWQEEQRKKNQDATEG